MMANLSMAPLHLGERLTLRKIIQARGSLKTAPWRSSWNNSKNEIAPFKLGVSKNNTNIEKIF